MTTSTEREALIDEIMNRHAEYIGRDQARFGRETVRAMIADALRRPSPAQPEQEDDYPQPEPDPQVEDGPYYPAAQPVDETESENAIRAAVAKAAWPDPSLVDEAMASIRAILASRENTATIEGSCLYEAGLKEGHRKGIEDAAAVATRAMAEQIYCRSPGYCVQNRRIAKSILALGSQS